MELLLDKNVGVTARSNNRFISAETSKLGKERKDEREEGDVKVCRVVPSTLRSSSHGSSNKSNLQGYVQNRRLRLILEARNIITVSSTSGSLSSIRDRLHLFGIIRSLGDPASRTFAYKLPRVVQRLRSQLSFKRIVEQ